MVAEPVEGKIVGRKALLSKVEGRHIAVDTDGRLLMVNLTTADISDSAGAQAIPDGIRTRWPWIKHLFADGAYDRLKLMEGQLSQLHPISTSSSRSSAARTTSKASRSCRAAASSSEPSAG